MAAFPMCPDCRQEYEDSTNRRFHAQPNACAACGPQLWLEGQQGEVVPVNDHDDVISAAAYLIRSGAIIAIKGIGGFHLACDATCEKGGFLIARARGATSRNASPMTRRVSVLPASQTTG